MAQITGFDKVNKRLKLLKTGTPPGDKTVVVGFTQNYAIYVHENLQAHHPVGQAKFLEQPFREMKNTFPKTVAKAMKNGATLIEALMIAGLGLQRAAQLLTPVDTSALKGSAFTCLEIKLEEASKAAHAAGEAIRNAEQDKRAKKKD